MAADILVIGATGYVGRYLVTGLAAAGYRVRALVRSREKAIAPGSYGAPALDGAVSEWVERNITEPGAATGVCQGVTRAVSALGVTRQPADPWDVDFRGNLSVLQDAGRHGVESFLYVNVMHVWSSRSMIMRSKAAFCAALEQSSIRHQLINPSGYFSDMSEFLDMARHGLVVLPPNPSVKVQPIHGEDLASFCISKLEEESGSWDVGGPDVLTYREIAECAFRALDKPVRTLTLPQAAVTAGVAVASRVGRRPRDLAEFFRDGLTHEATGELHGTHHLSEHFRALAAPK